MALSETGQELLRRAAKDCFQTDDDHLGSYLLNMATYMDTTEESAWHLDNINGALRAAAIVLKEDTPSE